MRKTYERITLLIFLVFAAVNAKKSETLHSLTSPTLRSKPSSKRHRRQILDTAITRKVLDEIDHDDDHQEDVQLRQEVSRGGARSALVADLLHRLKIGSYFALWYALNIIYNIINKKILNIIPAPLTVGAIQFGIGAFYAALVWALGLRERPKVNSLALISFVGLCHCSGQLFSMASFNAGTVSFTHIVKAMEPFFSALVSAIIFQKWMKPQVYATLIPVVAGVGYACLKERAFSFLAFITAMMSNVAFAFRAVTSKQAMSNLGLSSANLFGLVTWVAFLISVPLAWIGEGGWSHFMELWNSAITTTTVVGGGEQQDATAADAAAATATSSSAITNSFLIRQVIISGLFHYLNNEVMYLALSNVHPVTLAVGNTMKRVFIVVASVLVFRTPITIQVGIGSAIGIGGVLLYSLTKQYYEQQEMVVVEKSSAGKRRK